MEIYDGPLGGETQNKCLYNRVNKADHVGVGRLAQTRRLEAELEKRMQKKAEVEAERQNLTPVEHAIQRQKDLVGEPAAAVKEETANRWPRPRILAIVAIGLYGLFLPHDLLRLAVWGLILFLVGAVATGPERALETTCWLGRKFLGLWRVEIAIARKLWNTASQKSEQADVSVLLVRMKSKAR